MALQKSKNKTVFGEVLFFPNAYFKITNISGDKNSLDAQISVYTDKLKSHIIEHLSYTFVPENTESAERWDKQAYVYLKTLDEYKDAIDV